MTSPITATDNGLKKYRTPTVTHPKKQTQNLLFGATVLSIGGLLTKILGAIYRIPLTSILGAEGIGVYQTAFPVYCILLTFSSTGVPSAIAKLVASGYGERSVLKKALSIFLPIGFLGTALMSLFAYPIANLQGNKSAYLAYITLSPSVVIVSVISCLRGYFQGKLNVLPTAISQVIEQAVKLAVGLTLCFFLQGSPALKGGLACLAVTASEIVALVYLLACKKKDYSPALDTVYLPFKRLIATLLPITLSTILLPISRVFDSFTIVNLMSDYTDKATALYGVYTGGVESVSGVPVAVCYGFATAVLPQITKALSSGDYKSAKKDCFKSLSICLFLSTAFGLFLFLFSRPITNILFSRLSRFEKDVTAKLLSLSFFSVIGLSLLQTLASCIIAYDKPYFPCVSLGIGIAIKFFMQILLLKNPTINVFGSLYSDIACYFVAVFLNLLYIIFITNKERVCNENNFSRYRDANRRLNG